MLNHFMTEKKRQSWYKMNKNNKIQLVNYKLIMVFIGP